MVYGTIVLTFGELGKSMGASCGHVEVPDFSA